MPNLTIFICTPCFYRDECNDWVGTGDAYYTRTCWKHIADDSGAISWGTTLKKNFTTNLNRFCSYFLIAYHSAFSLFCRDQYNEWVEIGNIDSWICSRHITDHDGAPSWGINPGVLSHIKGNVFCCGGIP